MVDKLINEIQRERNGEIVERSLLRATVDMLIEVGIKNNKFYESEFEKIFIQETQRYYEREAKELISDNSCYTYLKRAKDRLNEEVDRVLSYLNESTEQKLINTFLEAYIKNHY